MEAHVMECTFVIGANYFKAHASSVIGTSPLSRRELDSFVPVVLQALPIDMRGRYQIGVDRIRVTANADFVGRMVPQGPCHDIRSIEIRCLSKRADGLMHARCTRTATPPAEVAE